MGMSGNSGSPNPLGLSSGLRNGLGIAGDAMAGVGGQQGVFGPAMAQQRQAIGQHTPEGAQAPTPLTPPAPQTLGDLQHLQHLPPLLQFFMSLQGQAHGGNAMSAYQNILNRGH